MFERGGWALPIGKRHAFVNLGVPMTLERAQNHLKLIFLSTQSISMVRLLGAPRCSFNSQL